MKRIPPTHFEELYCEQHRLSLDEFLKHIRRRALYPHARLLAPLFTLFNGDYLAADNDFIHDVAQNTHYNEFFNSSFEYIHHPANRGFLRRVLRIRISTERMRRIVRKTMSASSQRAPESQETMTPFRSSGKDGADRTASEDASRSA